MKVMLVYPKDIAENYFAKRPVMGIAYVGTVLEKASHEVLLVDMRLRGYTTKYFKKLLHKSKPDIVGFSLVALSLDQGYELMKIIKEETGAMVVVGGPEVTLLPTKFLNKPFVDYAFMGEGEYSLLEFVNRYERGESFYDIPGLCYRNEEGIPRINPPKAIQDLDALPFPNWDLFPLKKYKSRLSKIKFPITSSRGCPYSCSYCNNSYYKNLYKGKGKYIRRRSIDNIIAEIKDAIPKYKIKTVQFEDENFLVDVGWVKEFSEKYKKGVGLPFWCQANPNNITKEKIAYLKDAGCKEIFMGLESGNKKIREEVYNRYTTNEQIIKSASIIKGTGILMQSTAKIGRAHV